MSRTIVVIGATGAQGLAVVRHLLRPSESNSKDGGVSFAPSPWKVLALTRDPTHKRANELLALGAELVIGEFQIPCRWLETSRRFDERLEIHLNANDWRMSHSLSG